MKDVLKHLGAFLLWNIVVSFFLVLAPPEAGLPIALTLSAAFFWGYVLEPPSGRPPERRWATLRLRPLRGAALRWSIVAVPVVLLLAWALGDVYSRLVAVPPESLDPFGPIMGTPLGRLMVTIFAVTVAPMIEEFVFRGLIQRKIERIWGPAAGIGIAAGLFATVHFLPWVFPLHFFLGIAFGFAAYATRSIWTSVMLHTANNAAALIGLALTTGPGEVGTVWEIGVTADLWVSASILLVTIVLAAWTAQKLLQSGRAGGLPTS